MPFHRVHRNNIDASIQTGRSGMVLVTTGPDGPILRGVPIDEVRLGVTFGCRATVLVSMEPDLDDPEYYLCETRHVVLPGESDCEGT